VIADAVDTAVTLGWALLVWIVLTAAVGVAGVYAAVVAVAAPVNAAREALSGALAASGALRALRPLPESPDAPEGLLAASLVRAEPTGSSATGPSRTTVPRQNAPEGPGGTPGPPDAPEPARSRTEPHTPSWARKDAA
jgi:hypothetical protein